MISHADISRKLTELTYNATFILFTVKFVIIIFKKPQNYCLLKTHVISGTMDTHLWERDEVGFLAIICIRIQKHCLTSKRKLAFGRKFVSDIYLFILYSIP